MSEKIIQGIHAALAQVNDPELRRPLPELGMVEAVAVNDGVASVKIKLTISGCPMRDRLETDVQSAVLSVEGVNSVAVDFGVMNEEERDAVKNLIHLRKRIH